MLLVPLVTTLTGSFWKKEAKTRKRSNLEYTETWMDDVRFVYIEIAIKVYKCEDLLDFLKTNYKSSINIPLNLQKRFWYSL